MFPSVEVARSVQLALRHLVSIKPLKAEPGYVAGVDAAFTEEKVIAAVSLFEFPSLKHVEDNVVVNDICFPYVPGLLTFREGPAIADAVSGLSIVPDVIIFDGQGIAHPRRMGIASHMGVMMCIPAIGCAKSRLVGTYREPGSRRGSRTRLMHNGEVIGTVLRTRNGVKPLYVSPGHMVSFDDAVRIVLETTRGYRLPEPVRRADMLAKKNKQIC